MPECEGQGCSRVNLPANTRKKRRVGRLAENIIKESGGKVHGCMRTNIERQGILWDHAPDLFHRENLYLNDPNKPVWTGGSINASWEIYRARIGKPIPPRITIAIDLRRILGAVAKELDCPPTALVDSILRDWVNGTKNELPG